MTAGAEGDFHAGGGEHAGELPVSSPTVSRSSLCQWDWIRPQIGGAAVARLRVLRQPPEPASPTGWGVPARLRNLHSFRDGIQYAGQRRSRDDVKTVHLMHDSVDSTCYGG